MVSCVCVSVRSITDYSSSLFKLILLEFFRDSFCQGLQRDNPLHYDHHHYIAWPPSLHSNKFHSIKLRNPSFSRKWQIPSRQEEHAILSNATSESDFQRVTLRNASWDQHWDCVERKLPLERDPCPKGLLLLLPMAPNFEMAIGEKPPVGALLTFWPISGISLARTHTRKLVDAFACLSSSPFRACA